MRADQAKRRYTVQHRKLGRKLVRLIDRLVEAGYTEESALEAIRTGNPDLLEQQERDPSDVCPTTRLPSRT